MNRSKKRDRLTSVVASTTYCGVDFNDRLRIEDFYKSKKYYVFKPVLFPKFKVCFTKRLSRAWVIPTGQRNIVFTVLEMTCQVCNLEFFSTILPLNLFALEWTLCVFTNVPRSILLVT